MVSSARVMASGGSMKKEDDAATGRRFFWTPQYRASDARNVSGADERRPLLTDLEAGAIGALRARFGGTASAVPESFWKRLVTCQLCACPALTYTQRIMGFMFCFAAGVILTATSLMSITSLLLGNPIPFAIKYTLGNMLAMGAASFLVGPTAQCKSMFSRERLSSSVLYIASLFATLACIFYVHVQLLTLISIGVQFCAMIWYVSSYFPFGQSLLRRSVGMFL